MSRTSIKGQVLIDLVAEFAETPQEKRIKKQNIDEKLVGAIFLQEPQRIWSEASSDISREDHN